MRTELKYVELKSGFSDKGNAWIGLVSFSKSGRTIYFDGKGFQSLNGLGINGNYFDLETGDEYWISGVKKDMTDRHQFGGGEILVEKRILNDYLKIIGKLELPKSGYGLTEVITQKPTEKINELENSRLKKPNSNQNLYSKTAIEMTDNELEYVISELIEDENNALYNKGRRMIRRRRVKLEEEYKNRI